jgi:tetratricopeptide (TPR) repeat protein
MQLGRVFISSVFGGLLELRATAAAAARLAGLDPVLTELHVAQPQSVREALARELAACDSYVGLFNRRRGTVPATGTADQRAITEEEFRVARELGLRCLVFLSRVGDGGDGDSLGKGQREPGLAEFLDREVTDYAGGVWARPYDSAEALRREVVAGLATLRPRLVLALGREPAAPGRAAPGGLAATLHLGGVQPAWGGVRSLGPVAVELHPGVAAAVVFDTFRRGEAARSRLSERSLRLAGMELAAAAFPGDLGAALDQVLALAAAGGCLLVLEIRTADAAALALPWELLSRPAHPLPVGEGLLEVVRRPVLAGEPADPERDPAPSVPPLHLAVLGFTAAPVEDQAVEGGPGAGGLGDADLFWEREQERLLVALQGLVREQRGRLVLSDTGDGEELRLALARADRPQVVHLSCHGGVAGDGAGGGQPVLLLEDGEGRRLAVGAEDLLRWARAAPAADLELMVLAACSTPLAGLPRAGPATEHGGAVPAAIPAAVPPGAAPGLAERLVAGGIGRVLGMQSTISDEGATAFAAGFYAELGRGADLPAALRAGRAELAAHGRPHEWAVPVLLSRRGFGPLASPEGSAPPVATPVEVVRREFEIIGVSYLGEGYVGRRDTERRLFRAYARGERVLIIHGLGGIGKSTLAARFLERRRAAGARVLALNAGRRLPPAALLEEVAARVGVAHAPASPARAEGVAAAAAAFRAALAAGLAAVRPTLLLLDNFEDNQDDDGAFLDPELGETLAELAVLGGAGAFALVVTSRLPLTLPPGPVEAWNLDLGELPSSGCRKLRLLDRAGLGALDEAGWQRALRELGGHPKALELLGGYLRGRPDRARALLARWGEAGAAVDLRLAAERQERGRRLLVEEVLAAVPAGRAPALDRLCLLAEPLPAPELEDLLAADGVAEPGAELAWLRDRGLLARTAAPSALAGGDAVHRLLASHRQQALGEREGNEAARVWHSRVADHLEQAGRPLSDLGAAARHRDAAGDRAGAIGLYARWAVALRDRNAYGASTQVAREGVAAFPAGAAEETRAGAAGLWLCIAQVSRKLGDLAAAEAAVREALSLVAAPAGAAARRSRALALGERAAFLAARGQLDEALRMLREEQIPLYEALGDLRERALTLIQTADVLAARGQLDEALRILREQSRVFEALGDVRARAITVGRVADVLQARGQLDEALRIRWEEEIPVYEALGDVRERAVALGKVADVLQERGQLDEALRIRREEEIPAYEALEDVRSRAMTLGKVADVQAARGQLEGALRILREQIPMFEALGDVRSRAVTLGKVAHVLQARGQLDEVLRIRREEEIPVYQALGDVHALLQARTNLAQALRARAGPGDVAEARRLLGLALGAAKSLRLPEANIIGEILGTLPADPDGWPAG